MITETDIIGNGFSRHEVGPWKVWSRDSSIASGFLEQCCLEPKTSEHGFEAVSCGKDSDVYRFVYENRTFYFKEFLSRGWTDRVKDMFRGCRALRALEGEFALNSAGLNSPPILVIGTRNGRNFMVTEEVPDAINLYFMVTHPEKFPIPPHRFMVKLGHLIGNLHANGISHGDLRWGNILLNGQGKDLRFYFIDNERTVKYATLPDRLRFKNLVQMNMSANHLSRYHVLRFFAAYLEANPGIQPKRTHLSERVHLRTSARNTRLK